MSRTISFREDEDLPAASVASKHSRRTQPPGRYHRRAGLVRPAVPSIAAPFRVITPPELDEAAGILGRGLVQGPREPAGDSHGPGWYRPG